MHALDSLDYINFILALGTETVRRESWRKPTADGILKHAGDEGKTYSRMPLLMTPTTTLPKACHRIAIRTVAKSLFPTVTGCDTTDGYIECGPDRRLRKASENGKGICALSGGDYDGDCIAFSQDPRLVDFFRATSTGLTNFAEQHGSKSRRSCKQSQP
jgi:hypothetical protein